MIATITIDERAPTFNNAYSQTRNGIRFLKKEIKEYKTRVASSVKGVKFNYNRKKEIIEVEIYFYLTNAITKDGSISLTSSDYDGMIKITQDAIMDGIGINDSAICKATIYKLQGNSDKTIFIIKKIPIEAMYSFRIID